MTQTRFKDMEDSYTCSRYLLAPFSWDTVPVLQVCDSVLCMFLKTDEVAPWSPNAMPAHSGLAGT